MKNKKNILIIAGIIISINLLRVTGILELYRTSGVLMEPNYPDRTLLVMTNLKSVDHRSVIAFRALSLPKEVPGMPQEEGVYIGRVVGKGGDQVALRDGRVWLNGALVEEGVALQFRYRIEGEGERLSDAVVAELGAEEQVHYRLNPKLVSLSDDLRKKVKTDLSLYDSPIRNMESLPHRAMLDSSWTLNNYGPLQIPEGHLFILGDNRHDALDSRFRGFIPMAAVKGVLLKAF